jgi:hypothetical protein
MVQAATSKRLFANVPNDVFHLLKNSDPDAKRITTDFLRFKKEDVSIAANVPLPSVRYDTRMPEVLRERMMDWAVAINLVGSFFKDERRTILWFQTPNPLMGNVSPKEMILAGRFRKLLEIIQTALEENQPAPHGKA